MTEFRPGRFEILPVVIKNLLIINTLCYIAQITVGGNAGYFPMEKILALHHVKSPLFQPWQLITHMFLHGGWMHLFGNMFALWMFGSVLENLWGPRRFITFYFLCGIGAALMHLAFLWYDYNSMLNQFVTIKNNPTPALVQSFFNQYNLYQYRGTAEILQSYLANPGSQANINTINALLTEYTYMKISFPTLGASGAVFGILAAFVYLFPNTYIYLYFFVPVKAKWLGLAYFSYELFYAIQNSAGDDVARWAHIGGGIVGFLLVLTWNKRNRKNFY